MNIAQSHAALPVTASADPNARATNVDASTDGGATPGTFESLLSRSIEAGTGERPDTAPSTSAQNPGTASDGKGVKAVVLDPVVCGVPAPSLAPGADDALAAAAAKVDPATLTDPQGKAATDATSKDDPAAALAAATLLTGKGVQDDAKAAGSSTTSAKDDKTTKDDATPDAAASDLAAQIALVSQWAALAAPAAGTPIDPKTVTTGRSDIRDKLDTIRGASAKGGANRAIDAAALKDAAATTTATAAATALERATQAALPTTTAAATAKTAGDVLKDALAGATTPGSHESTMDKLIALAGGNALHAAPDASSTTNFAQQVALHAVSTAATPAADAAPAVNTTTSANNLMTLHEQVGTAAWSHEVGQAALRMAANDLQNVSLKMNPEHLGPVDVQMRMDNGVAHIQFAAAHLDTRQALEGSRSTLDQMFGQQGLKVGDWSVGQQSSNGSFARDFASANAGGNGNGSGNGTGGSGRGGDDDGGISATVSVRAQRALGLVDTFA